MHNTFQVIEAVNVAMYTMLYYYCFHISKEILVKLNVVVNADTRAQHV